MHQFFGVVAAIIIMGACIPYIKDILAGKVQPARATRLMFLGLLIVATLQSHDLGSKWSLLLLGGEILQGSLIFILSIKYGLGGLSKLDVACYGLLAIDIVFWVATSNTLVALMLTITADIIACIPTIIKVIKEPKSETPLFWFVGGLAALFAIFAEKNLDFDTIVFPIYLMLINWLVGLLTYRKGTTNKKSSEASEPLGI